MRHQQSISELNINTIKNYSISHFWLKINSDEFSRDGYIPLIIIKGKYSSPVIGVSAALHGNELNGISIIHKLVENINLENLKGTIVAIPGMNNYAISNYTRKFSDGEDLNRIFPGKESGNSSEQYVWNINQKILSNIDYLVDMHTASFGRINSLYVRADMNNKIIANMANAIDADIILNSTGIVPEYSTKTFRTEAMKKNIPAVTVEYGNPQVFQPIFIRRGVEGLVNLFNHLNIYESKNKAITSKAILCEKSYWIYTDMGGILDMKVDLKQVVKKGEVLAILRNPFGEIIKEYLAPEKGIIIGRSTNPINTSGGRIVHLGIIKKDKNVTKNI
ncbi:MAG: succinylglutamate desuccinylase/aspartoacylase family protein [Flavobacteriaceae bacterium]